MGVTTVYAPGGYTTGNGVQLSALTFQYHEDFTALEGLYHSAWSHLIKTGAFYPANAVDFVKLKLVPTIPGYAKLIPEGDYMEFASINDGIVTISAGTPTYSSNLNYDVLRDVAKDSVNFMADWLQSHQFKQLLSTAGKTAGTVAMVTSRIPATMPIALGAFVLNLALDFASPPVEVPPVPVSVTATQSLKWYRVSGSAPSPDNLVRYPLSGGRNLHDPLETAKYIASTNELKDAIAFRIREQALDWVSRQFHEELSGLDLNEMLLPEDRSSIQNQIASNITKSANNKKRRLDFGLDKTTDDLYNIFSKLSKLDKLDKLDLLSNLSKLFCICDNGQSIFSVLNDLKNLLSSGGLDANSLKDVLDSYFIPSSSPSSPNLSSILLTLSDSSSNTQLIEGFGF